MRLIDADAFKDYIRNALEETKHIYKDNGAWAKEITESFCKDIDEQPTIQPEQRTGKWIKCGWAIKCSECDYDMPFTVRNFCPNCGAKMDDLMRGCE